MAALRHMARWEIRRRASAVTGSLQHASLPGTMPPEPPPAPIRVRNHITLNGDACYCRD